jgi:ectoine hydroxylase-related dioxygenase (phytanoyl-CoA dioxygenase family)
MTLTDTQIADCHRDGYLHLEQIIDRTLIDECVTTIWDTISDNRDDPATWTEPVTRINTPHTRAFAAIPHTPALINAVAATAGADAQLAVPLGGTIPIRFPVHGRSIDDDGWHIDGSYLGPDGRWWVNHHSRNRAQLMLVLFTDIDSDYAPTRIRVGSHHRIRNVLEPYGDTGVYFGDIELPDSIWDCPVIEATGHAGDIYLCHPFLVHAAQPHRGHLQSRPTPARIVAQPGVNWRPGTEHAD